MGLQMSRAQWLAWMWLAAMLLWPGPVLAHLMPEQKGAINVQGDSVYVVVSIPLSALTDYDDNRDAVMSTDELQMHQEALRQQIDRRLLITHKGQTGQTIVVHLARSPLHEQTVQADQLIVLRHGSLRSCRRSPGSTQTCLAAPARSAS